MEILKKLYKFSQSWTGTVVIVLLVIFFFIQAFVIPSGSMKNTLLVGDFLFVKNLVMVSQLLIFLGWKFLFCQILIKMGI